MTTKPELDLAAEVRGLRESFCQILKMALVDLELGRPADAAQYLRAVIERQGGPPAGASIQ